MVAENSPRGPTKTSSNCIVNKLRGNWMQKICILNFLKGFVGGKLNPRE